MVELLDVQTNIQVSWEAEDYKTAGTNWAKMYEIMLAGKPSLPSLI